MPTQISNQALVTFEYGSQTGSALSNISTTNLQDQINTSKKSLGNTYYLNDDIFYILSTINNTNSEITNVSITDNLGTYQLSNGENATPLDYVGPAFQYVDGNFISEITPTINDNNIVFDIDSIPANSNLIIFYKAKVNNQAPLNTGSNITNTATWNIENRNSITQTNTITVRETPDIRIIKSMSPDPVNSGDEIRYSFVIQNYGNTAVENLVLTDAFNPVPSNIRVYLNNVLLSPTNYSYVNGVLTIPVANADFQIEVGPATFSQDPDTGVISISPEEYNITVVGTLN